MIAPAELEAGEAHWNAIAEGHLVVARQAESIDEWRRAMSLVSAARSVASHLFYARIAAKDHNAGDCRGYGGWR